MCFIKTPARIYIDYMPARLTTGKEWYIHFSVINPETQRLKRVRYKINRIPMKTRKRVAGQMVADINVKLALGWNPLIEAVSPKSYEKLSDAIDAFLKIKTKEMEENSIRSYSSMAGIFRRWLAGRGFKDSSFACSVSRSVALEFMNDIEMDDKKSARTYNNYLKFCQIMFNWMKGKGYIPTNPFDGIPAKPKKGKTRRVASDEELRRLFSYLSTHNPHYLAAVMLCYGCLIRPKELALLKVADIDLQNQLIHIRPEIAKNDKDSFRTIPNVLMPFFTGIDTSHPEWYLFANHPRYDFTPGPYKVCSRKLAKYWSDHLRAECNLPMEVQFYSLKDTGVTNFLEAGVPINTVQRQADHSSVAMTAIYVGRKNVTDEKLKQAAIFSDTISPETK
ncbi:MAG: tyrosine-type recombinase/integrase [Bacteroidales bacterium]|nr:tyrosine-type recombinase/integrase [Candidatus Cacconaster equifaecalis]